MESEFGVSPSTVEWGHTTELNAISSKTRMASLLSCSVAYLLSPVWKSRVNTPPRSST